MGTHPIFESDFDCLTDQKKKENVNKNRDRVGSYASRHFHKLLHCLRATDKSAVLTGHRMASHRLWSYLLGFFRNRTCHGTISNGRSVGNLVNRSFCNGWWCHGAPNLLQEPRLHHFLRGCSNLWHHRFDHHGNWTKTLQRRRSSYSGDELRVWLSRFWRWNDHWFLQSLLRHLRWNHRFIGCISGCSK